MEHPIAVRLFDTAAPTLRSNPTLHKSFWVASLASGDEPQIKTLASHSPRAKADAVWGGRSDSILFINGIPPGPQPPYTHTGSLPSPIDPAGLPRLLSCRLSLSASALFLRPHLEC
ncbi:hypothetical protein VTK73DRAFT_5216 [Phialemonium thermophilum]|uniref:Uncharacterized protein n=1 Tax=Phialemonium thermophilum TaxID=223376 RepID=A0ABR3V2S5_9PEZI